MTRFGMLLRYYILGIKHNATEGCVTEVLRAKGVATGAAWSRKVLILDPENNSRS